jgi:monomeric isocitrate dehydrogenase
MENMMQKISADVEPASSAIAAIGQEYHSASLAFGRDRELRSSRRMAPWEGVSEAIIPSPVLVEAQMPAIIKSYGKILILN